MLQDLGIEGSILGHVGDGNFHTLIATTPGDDRAQHFSEQLNQRALALGGTVSGEHGIGLAKRKYMAEEHGPAVAWIPVRVVLEGEPAVYPLDLVLGRGLRHPEDRVVVAFGGSPHGR